MRRHPSFSRFHIPLSSASRIPPSIRTRIGATFEFMLRSAIPKIATNHQINIFIHFVLSSMNPGVRIAGVRIE
jgi:hypothetical protein